MESININKRIAKPILYLSKFFNDNYFILVCKGYNEDDDNYTGLYWDEDKDLYFLDKCYTDYQIWFKLFSKVDKIALKNSHSPFVIW